MISIRKIFAKKENMKNNIAIKREINQGGGKILPMKKINPMEKNIIEHKKIQELQNKIIGQRNNIALTKGVIPDPRKRQFIKKGILGIIAGIGIAVFSKIARADGGFINSADGTSALNFLGEGTITKPNQPSVFAHLNADDVNETGDGTVFTVIFDTEIYDQNADFDGTSTFTAPVTGRYLVTISISVGGILTTMTAGEVIIVASNRSVRHAPWDPGVVKDAIDRIEYNFSHVMDMDAADTVTITCTLKNGTKVADILGNVLGTSISIALLH